MGKLSLRAVALLAMFASFVIATPVFAAGAANDHTVLILASSVNNPDLYDYLGTAPEITAAIALGMDVEMASDADWAAKSQADFATYRAIILGDATCGYGNDDAAEANTATWGPAVTGNVFIIGSDPVFHGITPVTEAGIAFAIADENKTGAYITLSCYFDGAADFTHVSVLDAFGSFSVRAVDCYSNVHITATHPALATLSDATLSNWFCSVHEGFDSWPTLTFQVLAIATDAEAVYTAPDGTTGVPYILARGATVISDIDLTPLSATGTTGTNHTLTATVTADGSPVIGTTVDFDIVGGPNTGMSSSSSTDDAGQATWMYSSTLTGTDYIQATFYDAASHLQTSNIVTMEWTAPVMEITGQPLDVTVCTNQSASFTVTTIGDGLSFAWYKVGNPVALSNGGNISGATTATLTINPATTADAGDYYVIVSGPGGSLTSDEATLTVNAPPTISVTVNPSYIWPPNHNMVNVAASVSTTGACGPLTVTLVSVTSNEADDAPGSGDGATVNDVQGVGVGAGAVNDFAFSVRAERAAAGTGRVYTATYMVTDAANNTATAQATISVPLNQR
jgi:hypothetical protein